MKLKDVAPTAPPRTASRAWSSTVTSVLAVREVAAEAVERARAGGGPTLIECKTWRHWGHFIGDMAKYRDPAEHEAWLKRDPIPAFAAVLLARGAATEAELQTIQEEADAEMDAAVEFGRPARSPTRPNLTTDVYVGDPA